MENNNSEKTVQISEIESSELINESSEQEELKIRKEILNLEKTIKMTDRELKENNEKTIQEMEFNIINIKYNQKNEILEERRKGVNIIGQPLRRYETINSRSILHPRYCAEIIGKISFPFKRKWTENNDKKICFSTKRKRVKTEAVKSREKLRSKRQRKERRLKQLKEKWNELLTEDEKLEQEIQDTIKTRKNIETEIKIMKEEDDKQLEYKKRSEERHDENEFDELENIRIFKPYGLYMRIFAIEEKIIPKKLPYYIITLLLHPYYHWMNGTNWTTKRIMEIMIKIDK